ncbi:MULTISPECIES: hypothetical protein [Halobacteriales]|uniref:hypothetical protein n=1 Tax=Halobacteriales TaxID=2235 RepID=UPI001E36BA41|nr:MULTISPECIES: hypothetical protein [Halobacteria]
MVLLYGFRGEDSGSQRIHLYREHDLWMTTKIQLRIPREERISRTPAVTSTNTATTMKRSVNLTKKG